MFGHVNKDLVIPELQLLERLDRLMVAAEALGEAAISEQQGAIPSRSMQQAWRKIVAPSPAIASLNWMPSRLEAHRLPLRQRPNAGTVEDEEPRF
jgi:hypothetical protein